MLEPLSRWRRSQDKKFASRTLSISLTTRLAITDVAETFDRAPLLGMRAIFLAGMGRPGDAVASAEQAVAAANECGSTAVQARADSALGLALADTDPERAIIHLERCRASRDESTAAGMSFADIVGISSGDRRLARLRAATGELPAALAIYAQQLEVFIPELDSFDVVCTCESLAVDLSHTEHHDTAVVLFGALEAPAGHFQGNPSVGRPAAVEELSARLGDDRYQTLADRGRAMTPAQMLDYARAETNRLLAELTNQ